MREVRCQLYEWLLDYQRLTDEIVYLEFNLDRNERELGRWTLGDLSKVKLTEGSIASGLEEYIEAIEYELAHKMNDAFNAKKLISTFKGLENQILYGRYIEGKMLSEVAFDLGYTIGHVYNKHAQIMRMIDFADKIKSSSF